MNFYLGVWRSETTLSDKDAAKRYVALSEGQEIPKGFDAGVYKFHAQLTDMYPDLDLIPEDEEESSPWACSLEVSSTHVIMAIQPEWYTRVFPVILQLADQHGLVCYDPQNEKVHLSAHLERNPVDVSAE